MRKTLFTLALAGTLMMAPGLTPAAHARPGAVWLSVGSGFRVGGLNLSLVFGRPFGYDGYYYRSPRPIVYRGAHCTSRCFVERGIHYHDRDCPVIHGYFRGYGYDPYDVYSRYAPRYDGYYDGYYDGGYYDGGYYDGYYDGGYSGGVIIYNRGYSRDRHYRDHRYDRGYSSRGHHDRRYDGHYDRDRGHDRDRRDRDGGHHRDGGYRRHH